MRLMSRRTAMLAAALAIGLAPQARADDVTEAQASDLEAQLHGWLGNLLGPRAHLPPRPVRFAAAGDHFAVSLPLGELFAVPGGELSGAPLTANARPLEGGRWALDTIAFASPLRASVTMPGQGVSTTTVSADSQEQHAMLDPTLATASSWDSSIKGYATRTEGKQGTQTTRIEDMVSHVTWQPAGNGRVDMLQDLQGSLLTVDGTAADAGRVSFSAERLHGTLHMDSVALASVAPMIHAAYELMPLAKAAAKPKLTPDLRLQVDRVLDALGDFTSGFGEQFSLDNLRVDVDGHGGHATHMEAGMTADAPDGKLALRLRFALDGLDSPEIPPGVYRDYLPRHIAIAPRFAGVPARDVMDLLRLAVHSEGDDKLVQARAEALLQKGPFTFGLDELALDLGPAVLTGTGSMQMAARDTYSGEAHVELTGMDALLRQAGSDPMLQQGVPVLIMLKGLGQTDGEKMVWNIAYADGKLLVNGNDLSQMMPGK